MPELPEVEIVARHLRQREPSLIGRTIKSVDVLWQRTLATHTHDQFNQSLLGYHFTDVARHGKVIIITLQRRQTDASLFLLVHLRMSGRLDVVPSIDAHSRHARVLLHLDHDVTLRFDDARKFGRMWLTADPHTVIGDLGPDALTVTQDEFVSRACVRKGAIKAVLLDQSFIAGVGNIYADEALFDAKIHPKTSAHLLSDAQAAALYNAVKHQLIQGIAANGATFDWVYPDGEYQEKFKVYGRTDEACVQCGTSIQRILVQQRSTHFCPRCQPQPTK